MSNAVIEAYAYGGPGYLFEAKNVNEFTEKLRKFTMDESLSKAMGIQA